MTTSFQDILKQKSAALSQSMTTPKKPDGPLECTVTIDDNVKPAELHVWFNRYPGPDIIADLKAAGFRWNSRVWWAIDSEPKRAFCRARLNAKELDPFVNLYVEQLPEDKPIPKIIVAPEVEPAKPDTSPFGIYKCQVNELLEYLKIEAADLQLLAIDKLHKATFGRN